MSFFGKEYKLETQENFDAFLNSMKDLSDAHKSVFLNHKPTTKLVKDGDSFILTSTKPDGSVGETRFKSGVEFDEEINGNVSKTTYTFDGKNTLTQVQKFKDGLSITFKREFTDSDLVATITSSSFGGVAKRFYKAV